MWPTNGLFIVKCLRQIQNQNFNFNGLELILVVVGLRVYMISNDTKKNACYVI